VNGYKTNQQMSSLLLIFICLMFSAFFSGMEIAFISSSKLRIELANKQGDLSGRIYSFFMKHPARFIGAMLVGNNIALVIYGISLAKLMEPRLLTWFSSEFMILIAQTVIATLIVLITAEFIPKTLFRVNPNRILTLFTLPALTVYYFLYPLVWVIIAISDLILKYIIGVRGEYEKPVFGKIDLDNYLKESLPRKNRTQEETEVKIFRNALDFSKVKIRDCMVPRTEITALGIDEPIEVLQKNFIETGLSRILIYKEDIEHIVGYAHSYEMFKKPESIKSILLPISLIPESMSANDLLKAFIKQQRSIAVVLDEFGGTAGMVTMEDVMEELFGEIEDEHDNQDLLERKMNKDEYLLSGRLEIDYINDKYHLDLPVSDEYETLSGMIIFHFERIPAINESIKIANFSFNITEVSETRIEKAHLYVLEIKDETS